MSRSLVTMGQPSSQRGSTVAHPILFLDVDGVLNDVDTNSRASALVCAIDQDSHIERACVDRLARVCEATDCRIVISSTWRLHAGDDVAAYFREWVFGPHEHPELADRIIGRTPDTRAHRADGLDGRGHEIAEWLDAQYPLPEPGPTFAVVDDDPVDSHPHVLRRVVRTSYFDGGLTDAVAERLIAVLRCEALGSRSAHDAQEAGADSQEEVADV